jgi:hypothetical protein
MTFIAILSIFAMACFVGQYIVGLGTAYPPTSFVLWAAE